MTFIEIKELALVASAGLTALLLIPGAILALFQYSVKLREEKRLATSARAETDVRLIKAFTELMDLTIGRCQHLLSEKAVEEFFKLGLILKGDFNNDFSERQKGSEKLSAYAVVTLPVGNSGQEAAFAAIITLAEHYPVLRYVAVSGLKGISSHNCSMAKTHQERIKRLHRMPN